MPRTSGTRPKGNGAGHGGPAKGYEHKPSSGTWASGPANGPGVPFEPGHVPAPRNPDKAERVARHVERLERIALEAHEAGRFSEAIAATNAVLDRLDGKPIARNLNVAVDDLSALSDAELHAEIARLSRGGSPDEAGTAPPSVPGKLAGVVH